MTRKKSPDTLITLKASTLSRAVDTMLVRIESGRVSKNSLLNDIAVAVAGRGHDWGRLKNTPSGHFVQSGLKTAEQADPPSANGNIATTPSAPALEATFTPQVWFRDNAMEVDPEGETSWIIDRDELDDLLAQGHDREDLMVADSHESDLFKTSRHAPEWVVNWSGPFYISLREISDGDGSREDGGISCRSCGDPYSAFGDGFDGECPSCADRSFIAGELGVANGEFLIDLSDVTGDVPELPGQEFTAPDQTGSGQAIYVAARFGPDGDDLGDGGEFEGYCVATRLRRT